LHRIFYSDRLQEPYESRPNIKREKCGPDLKKLLGDQAIEPVREGVERFKFLQGWERSQLEFVFTMTRKFVSESS